MNMITLSMPRVMIALVMKAQEMQIPIISMGAGNVLDGTPV